MGGGLRLTVHRGERRFRSARKGGDKLRLCWRANRAAMGEGGAMGRWLSASGAGSLSSCLDRLALSGPLARLKVNGEPAGEIAHASGLEGSGQSLVFEAPP